jgi:membrane-associated protease RseP (regulator of RpoE activity)
MPADDPAAAEPVAGASPPPPRAEEGPLLDERGEPLGDDDDAIDDGPQPFRWKANLVLFLLTVVSTFYAGAEYVGALPYKEGRLAVIRSLPTALPRGWSFAVPLLAILLTHEFGHYIAARVHRVEASLPFFIPLPHLSPFGTMGAVISMPRRIRSRDALIDIGAAGPLAGIAVAIPVLVLGLLRSKVGPMGEHAEQEGQCLLYLLIKRLVLGPIPAGHDVFLSPMAFAGWAGLLVTMLNLVPVAQLDGGHIAYALFGPRQNRYARVLHGALLAAFAWNLAVFVGPVVLHRAWDKVGQAVNNSVFWLVWYALIAVIKTVGGADHPPTEPGDLSFVRRGVAVLSLVLFVLLFMPTPMWAY